MQFQHTSVLLAECIEGLRIRPDGIYVDGTLGGAGHARCVAEKLTEQMNGFAAFMAELRSEEDA